MEADKICKHERVVQWFPDKPLKLFLKKDTSPSGVLMSETTISTVVFKGCLDCGKVIVKDYGK